MAAPVVTADKSNPPAPIVTKPVPEFPTMTSPAKLARVFKSKVMVLSATLLSKVMPAMPAAGAVSKLPEVAAVIVSVLFTGLKDICTSVSVVPEEERVNTI